MVDDALEYVLCGAAKQNRRMRLLGGLGIGTHRREIEEFAVKLRGILGPERLQYLERLPRLGPAARKIAAKYLHFLLQPPCADAKNEAAAAMVIEGSNLLGQCKGLRCGTSVMPVANRNVVVTAEARARAM